MLIGLEVFIFKTASDIAVNEGMESRPVELLANGINCSKDTRVTSDITVMSSMKNHSQQCGSRWSGL